MSWKEIPFCSRWMALLPAVFLLIKVHRLPLLALSWGSVHLLGQLGQADLLEVVLSEQPAGADCRCFGLSLLCGHRLKLLSLKQEEEEDEQSQQLPWFTLPLRLTHLRSSSPLLLCLRQTSGARPPTPRLHHHRSCWHSPSRLVGKIETYISSILSPQTVLIVACSGFICERSADLRLPLCSLHLPPGLQLLGCSL